MLQRWIYPITVIFSLFSLFHAVFAHADHPEPAGETPGTAVSRSPKATLAVGAALDSDGRLWLARVENQRLLVSHSDDDGKNFSVPVAVTPERENIASDGENRPKIAVAADGTVLLTWVQSLSAQYAGNVRFSRSTDSGRTFSTPVTLNDDGRITSHRFDALAIDGGGRVAIAWLDGRDRDAAREQGQAFSGVSIYTVQSYDNGLTFGKNRRFHAQTCECCRIALTWSQEGPVAFWRNIFGANTRDFAIGYLDKGQMRRVTDDEWQIDACPHNGGSMVADGQGQLHLVWFTNGAARQGLFYKRVSKEWESTPMPVGNPESQPNNALLAAAGRTLILTWREFDGESYAVEMMHSNDDGATWSEPARLMESSGATDYPVPLIDDKKVLIVWNTAKDGLLVFPMERFVKRQPG